MKTLTFIKWALIGLTLLTLLIILLAGVLLGTKKGSGVLLNGLNNYVIKDQPGLTIVNGTPRALIHGINLKSFAWKQDTLAIEATDLDIHMSLFCLNSLALCLEDISLEKLTVIPLPGAAPEKPEKVKPERITLAEISTPIPIHIKKISVKQFDWGAVTTSSHDASAAWLKQIHWAAKGIRWKKSRLTIEQSEAGNSLWQHSMAGRVSLSGDYPLQLRQNIAITAGELPEGLKADFNLSGAVANLQIAVRVQEPQPLEIAVSVKPLLADLPVTASLQADLITAKKWSVNAPPVSAKNFQLEASGDIRQLSYELATLLKNDESVGSDFQPLQTSGAISAEALQINQLILGHSKNQLSLNGALNWQPAISGKLALRLNHFEPGTILPIPVENVHGQTDIAFTFDRAQSAFNIDANLQPVEFSLDRIAYRASGKLRTDEKRVIHLDGLSVATKNNSITLQGTLAPIVPERFATIDTMLAWLGDSSVTGQIDAKNLAELSSNLRGQLQAKLSTGKNSALRVSALANKLSSASFSADKLSIDGLLQTNLASSATSTLKVQADNARTASVQWDALQINASGNYQRHKLMLAGNNKVNKSSAQIVGEYSPLKKTWRGQVEDLAAISQYRGVNSSIKSEGAITLNWQAPKKQLNIEPFCLSVDTGKLCTSKSHYTNQEFDLEFTVNNLDLSSTQSLFPENLRWQGLLSGNGQLQKAAGKEFQFTLAAQGTPGFIASNGTAAPLRLEYENLRLAIAGTAQNFSADFSLENNAVPIASAHIELSGKNFSTLNGNLKVEDFPVGVLAPLVPDAEILQAKLNLNLRASGPVAEPNLTGSILLDEGRFKLKRNATDLKAIKISGTFNNTLLDLQGDFKAGDGSGNLQGQLNFASPVQGTLKITGDKLQIDSRPLLNLWSNFDITANLLDNKLAVTGTVAVPEGKIEIKQLPRSAQVLTSDITFVKPQVVKKTRQAKPLELTTKLDISLGPKLEFIGFDASASLNGRFAVSQVAGKRMQGSGEIKINDGKYRGYGQKLDVRRGSLLFNGPLDEPEIDLEAVRKVGTAVVGIKVTGPAREPQLIPFSEPPLPDDEVLFRLVTGRSPGSKTTNSENQLLAQALVSGGIKFGGTSISDTAEKLGIQNFNVGTGDESDLLVSGYLDPSLYIEYGVNALGDNSAFKLRWDFARRLSLELIGGLQSSLDLLYAREF